MVTGVNHRRTGETMTIQVSISGHATGKDNAAQEAAENAFLVALGRAVQEFRDDNEVYTATATTQHHGTVNLAEDHGWTRTGQDADVPLAGNPDVDTKRDEMTGGV